jgi:endonuclease/exonuclease/phosphatase family metal-dependent hydrolase
MSNLRVMTFNLRGAVIPDGENIWPHRARFSAEVIRREDPDLIGFQEVQEGNLESYREFLTGYERAKGPQYNNHEPYCYATIFWKPEKLERLDSGGFWLSKTPHEFSGDWGTRYIRSAHWIRFREIDTGIEFVFLNTHLDHISEEARREGSRVIIEQLKVVAEGLPIIATGDFNSNPGSAAHEVFLGEGFEDVYLAAGNEDSDDTITFHAFTGEKQSWERRIDWILTRGSNGEFGSASCEIVKDARPPLYPSDHYPVQATIRLASPHTR